MFKNILWMAALLSVGLAQSETIIFSNLINGQYGPDSVGVGGSSSNGSDPAAALRFAVARDSTLTSFNVALIVYSGLNEATAFLLDDAYGQPGDVIETYRLNDLPYSTQTSGLTSILSLTRPLLRASEDYWFAVNAGESTLGGWVLTLLQGNSGASSDFAVAGVVGDPESNWVFGSGGPSGREGTLVVTGQAIPEPGTAWSTALSLLMVSILWRSRPLH